MSKANEGLPEAAKPRVFHHEGKRLFLIDGEPRVVDVDLASNLDREGGRYIRKLIKRHLPRLEKQGKLLCFKENGELGYGSPIQDDMLFLLKQEGIVSATGVKPTIAFLNKKQARWIVAKSDTDAADDLLERLFELYDAWEAGTLQPAPAIEPKTVEARLLERIVAGEPRPEDPRVAAARSLTLDEWREAEASMIRDSASCGVFEPVPFLVDETHSMRIRYSELGRLFGHGINPMGIRYGELGRLFGPEVMHIYAVVHWREDWLRKIAPLYQRRERGGGWKKYHEPGGIHTATYLTLGQAIAIGVSLGRDDAETVVSEAFALFERIMSDYADQQAAWRQKRLEADAKRERAETLLGASIEQLRASHEGVALLREISAKLDRPSGSAPQPVASRGWRFWRRG
jgi:hypothetical protein